MIFADGYNLSQQADFKSRRHFFFFFDPAKKYIWSPKAGCLSIFVRNENCTKITKMSNILRIYRYQDWSLEFWDFKYIFWTFQEIVKKKKFSRFQTFYFKVFFFRTEILKDFSYKCVLLYDSFNIFGFRHCFWHIWDHFCLPL